MENGFFKWPDEGRHDLAKGASLRYMTTSKEFKLQQKLVRVENKRRRELSERKSSSGEEEAPSASSSFVSGPPLKEIYVPSRDHSLFLSSFAAFHQTRRTDRNRRSGGPRQIVAPAGHTGSDSEGERPRCVIVMIPRVLLTVWPVT